MTDTFLAIVVATTTLGIAFQVLFLLSMRSAIENCAPQNREISPGQVWLYLVPLFNLIWQFLMVSRISESIEREFAAREIIPASPQEGFGKGVGIAMCCLTVASVIPILGIFAGFAAFVCWIIYWVKIAGYSRVLEASGTAFAAGYPAPAAWGVEPKPVYDARMGWPALIVVALGMFSAGLPGMVRATSMVGISRDMSMGSMQIGWMFSIAAYSLMAGYVVMTIVTTVSGARTGFLVSLAGVAIAALATGLASDSTELTVAFAAVSLCSGGLLPAAILAIRDGFAPQMRPLAIGMLLAVAQLPSLLVRLIVPSLTSGATWRVLVPASAIPAVIAVLACFLVWPAPGGRPRSWNISGTAVLATFMLAVGLFLTAPVVNFLGAGLTLFARVAMHLSLDGSGTAQLVISIAAICGSLLTGAIAWVMEAGGAAPSRARAVLLTICGVVLPCIALSAAVSSWAVLMVLAAACSLAYRGWSTLLYSAVADTMPAAAVAIAAAIGAIAAQAGGILSNDWNARILSGSASGWVPGLAASIAGIGVIAVALPAWLARMDPLE